MILKSQILVISRINHKLTILNKQKKKETIQNIVHRVLIQKLNFFQYLNLKIQIIQTNKIQIVNNSRKFRSHLMMNLIKKNFKLSNNNICLILQLCVPTLEIIYKNHKCCRIPQTSTPSPIKSNKKPKFALIVLIKKFKLFNHANHKFKIPTKNLQYQFPNKVTQKYIKLII